MERSNGLEEGAAAVALARPKDMAIVGLTNPASFSTRPCAVTQRSALRFCGFFGLRDGRFGQRFERAVESLRAFVGFKFTRFFDELLALGSLVGLFSLLTRH